MAEREAATATEANAKQATAAAARTVDGDPAAATRKEYGTWVASEPIYFGTALGYNRGDAVGAGVVEAHGLSEQVVKVGTKAHKDLRASLGLPPLED